MEELERLPSQAEIHRIINNLRNGKSLAEDGLAAAMWQEEKVLDQLKHAQIVTIYKNRGNKADCANYRGIESIVDIRTEARLRKTNQEAACDIGYGCDICRKKCVSGVGLAAYMRQVYRE